MSAPILISRSAVDTRKLCQMKRYRAYHQRHPDHGDQPGGLAPLNDSSGWVKTRGQIIHTALDKAIRGEDWVAHLDKEPALLPQPFGVFQDDSERLLWLTLIRRSVTGWLETRWKANLQHDFTPVSAEEEWEWLLHPLVGQSLRLDQIWRRKSDGHLMIVDFKTLSQPDANWIDRHRNSDQTHLYVQALVERTQEPVLGIQYEGLILGKKNPKTGVHTSPLINFYMTSQGTLSAKWKAGVTHYSHLSIPDATWMQTLEQLAPGYLAEQYCTTGPLSPPPTQLLQTKAATVEAEIQWADKMARIEHAIATHGEGSDEAEALLGRLVERSSASCLKFGWGYACPYMGLCWDGERVDLENFQPRIDHHVEGE